jgi:hypothetical protein
MWELQLGVEAFINDLVPLDLCFHAASVSLYQPTFVSLYNMAPLNIFVWQLALFAVIGVNAGPCRPSSDTVTASLEATSTVPSLTETTTSDTETISLTISATESSSTDIITTTTLATTTSAAPVQEPEDTCLTVQNPYTVPNRAVFQVACGSAPTSFQSIGGEKMGLTFKACMDACEAESLCRGVAYYRSIESCSLWSSADALQPNILYDAATVALRAN